MSNESATPVRPNTEGSKAAGLASIGCIVVGGAGIILAVLRHDPSGSGACLIASALAFGLLANAVLRD